jgi:1,2-diacylglycerol-3-alpha-glucose alpha-1,2-glucosyltransferase
MKVQVYMGSFKLLEKSGIGRSILHQWDILEKQGIEVTGKMEKDVDAVHINSIIPSHVFAAILAKIRKKKVVYYAHSTMEDFQNSFKGSNLLAPLFKKWIMFCYSLGDVIMTPTDYSKDLIESYGMKQKIYPMSNGIDTEFYSKKYMDKKNFHDQYEIKENHKVVISVGHFIERKGIIDFINVAKKMPQVKFIWFGYTNLSLVPHHVKEAIENAPTNLAFAGYVSREELRNAYCSADLFAFMSHEETEGIVVLEALSCMIPTIVRDIPVYEHWLKNQDNVLKASSNLDFEKKIRENLQEKNHKIIESGKRVAESRSIFEIGKRMTNVYEQLSFC